MGEEVKSVNFHIVVFGYFFDEFFILLLGIELFCDL